MMGRILHNTPVCVGVYQHFPRIYLDIWANSCKGKQRKREGKVIRNVTQDRYESKPKIMKHLWKVMKLKIKTSSCHRARSYLQKLQFYTLWVATHHNTTAFVQSTRHHYHRCDSHILRLRFSRLIGRKTLRHIDALATCNLHLAFFVRMLCTKGLSSADEGKLKKTDCLKSQTERERILQAELLVSS